MCAFSPCISSGQYLLCLPPRLEEQEVAAVKSHDLFPKLTYLEREPQGSRMVFPKEQLNPSPSVSSLWKARICLMGIRYFYFDRAINKKQQHLPTQLSGVWQHPPKQILELAWTKTQKSFKNQVQIQLTDFELNFPCSWISPRLKRNFNQSGGVTMEASSPTLKA